MTKNNLVKYSDKQAICEVLGSLMQNPKLLKEYKLTKSDFPETFHKLIFAAINNLYMNGVQDIDTVAIDEYISHFDVQYEIFSKNNGINFLETIQELAIVSNVKYYYDQVKKFSLLRSYVENGFNVSMYYDPDETDTSKIEEKRALLNKSSIMDIITFYKRKQLEISAPYVLSEDRDSKKAGVGGKEQKEKWKQGVSWGIGYASAYLTTAIHGLRKKRLTVKSAGTGIGKTRSTIGDIAFACSPKYYDKKREKWCANPNGVCNGVLYIGTEMELLEEIDPILWAYIADVPQEHIEFGCYEDGEEERVDEAIRILTEEANIWLEYIPEYDASALEEVIERHKLEHNIDYVFFDYIHTTVELISEYAEESKVKMVVREDQVLAELSKKMKSFTRKYNVSIDTCTQVNGNFKDEANRDQTIVAGAKSILNKADTGLIAMPPTPKELKTVEPILQKLINSPKPNVIYSLYKNRGGKWNRIKIWLYIDYDTMRVHDLFVTDYEYNLITEMPKTYINVINGIGKAANTPMFKDIMKIKE